MFCFHSTYFFHQCRVSTKIVFKVTKVFDISIRLGGLIKGRDKIIKEHISVRKIYKVGLHLREETIFQGGYYLFQEVSLSLFLDTYKVTYIQIRKRFYLNKYNEEKRTIIETFLILEFHFNGWSINLTFLLQHYIRKVPLKILFIEKDG